MTVGVLVMAYGTPASPDEVLPYYIDIRRGRPPTDEQLADLMRRYAAIGGLSPLLAITHAQRDALRAALGDGFDVEIGMKHTAPTIEDGVAALEARGVERIVGLVLAPHFSAMSVGQYLQRAAAAATVPFGAVESWATEPAYVQFLAQTVAAQLATMPAATKVVFTAHSLPQRIVDAGDPYPTEVRSTAAAVAARLGFAPFAQWSTAWQSAGRTPEPWLGPDILLVIDEFAAMGKDEHAEALLVCPCGFVADHLEVLYDLDIEARQRAEARGLMFERTASLNADPTVLGALAARVRAIS